MSESQFVRSEDDDIFNEWLGSEEAKEKEKKNRFPPKEYEKIKYVGLSKEHPTIVRFVGNFVEEDPLAHRKNPSDMKFMHISKIKDDSGKVFYLYLPLRGDDPETDHIMWRIIDKVFAKEWIKDPKTGKKKSVDVNESEHPAIYEMVKKGGFTAADGEMTYKCARGWKGPEMFLINCIDRRDDWCKVNKHTKILSKNVNVSVNKDGQETEFADFGVPAYGFFGPLTTLRKNFKQGWEKFDVVITRTGTGTETVNNLFNGTAFTSPAALQAGLDKGMGIKEEEYKFISQNNDLTDEELSYQRYDLDENFKTTSYHTLKKKLFKSIQKIDLELDTHFAQELTKLEEEESKKWKEENEKESSEKEETPKMQESSIGGTDTPPVVDSEWHVQEEKVVRRAVAPEAAGLSAEKIAVLKGYSEMSAEEKSYIKDVILKADGTLDHIEWTDTAPALLPCPEDQGGCGQMSPNSAHICPACGKHFA